jgi:hypothetical protein
MRDVPFAIQQLKISGRHSKRMSARILSFVAENTSTRLCALTRRSAISPHSNSSSAGSLNKRKPSVTNHVDEYIILYC